jgi:hypothetical protein
MEAADEAQPRDTNCLQAAADSDATVRLESRINIIPGKTRSNFTLSSLTLILFSFERPIRTPPSMLFDPGYYLTVSLRLNR